MSLALEDGVAVGNGEKGKTMILARIISLCCLAALILFISPSDANAESKRIWAHYDADNDVYIEAWIHDGQDAYYVWKNGSLKWVFIPGNPNPEDGDSSDSGDVESLIRLLEQLAGGGIARPEFWDTPAGQYLGNKGKGIDPYHNPNGDSGGGIVPGTGGGQKDPQENYTSPAKWGGMGGFDGSGNGGTIGDQLAILKQKGKKGNGDDDDGDSDPTNGDGLFGGLPAPPEIVNPDPVSRGFVLVSPVGSSRGARAGRSARTGPPATANPALQLGAFGPIGARPIGAAPVGAGLSPLAGGR